MCSKCFREHQGAGSGGPSPRAKGSSGHGVVAGRPGATGSGVISAADLSSALASVSGSGTLQSRRRCELI